MPVFTSAVLGLLIPEVTKGLTGLFSEWQAGREHKRNLERLTLAHEQGIELKELEAFTKAQMDLSGGMPIPASGDSWKQWVPAWVAIGINALIHSVRPIITYAAIPVLIYVLATTTGPKRDDLLDEIVLTCVACLRYWYGYREELRKSKKA